MKYYCSYKSPLGLLHLVSNGSALIGLHFDDTSLPAPLTEDPSATPFPQTAEQLDRYFQGELQEFDVSIALHGTDFQVRAWNELKNIPFGQTISYKAQAERIGSAARAVGLANGQNPIAIILPCHRVIGANGTLVGYGGGLARKLALLQFEATVRDFGPQPLAEIRSAASVVDWSA